MASVTLLSYSPNPEKTIAAAAKLCYSSAGIEKLMEISDEKASDFVEMLSEMGHESPIEHVSFTFGLEGVSRALLAQITRHRIASYSVQSQRYVREKQFAYVTPLQVEQIPEAKMIFDKAMETAQKEYDELAALLKQKHLEKLCAQGIPEKEACRRAEKLAIEDARFILPNACATKMVVTMNARSLMNFFSKRCCNRAQWEIREVADKMLALVYAVAPTLFKKAGPECCRGCCPEGKMSCGQDEQMRAHIGEIKESV